MADTENPSTEPGKELLPPLPEDSTCSTCGKVCASGRGLRAHASQAHGLRYATKPNTLQFAHKKTKDLERLQPWHMTGLIHHWLYGMPYKTWCEEFRNGKGVSTLTDAAKSPAGKRFKQQFDEIANDTVAMMRMVMELSTPEAFADEAFARYLARQAKDYEALHRFNKDIGLKQLLDSTSKESDTPPQIVINIQGDGFSDQEVKTSFEVLEAEVVDDD